MPTDIYDPMEGCPTPTWDSVYEGPEPLYNEDGVDLTQIREMLAMSPTERLRHKQKVSNSLARLRHAAGIRSGCDVCASATSEPK